MAAPTGVILPRPESPLSETWVYRTDILSSIEGVERRLIISEHPEESWNVQLLLESETEIRRWKADLFRDAGTTFKFPLWHESVALTADADSGETVLVGDFSLAEIVATNEVLLVGGDETVGAVEVATVQSIAAGSLTVSTGISNNYLAGDKVMLLRSVLLPDLLKIERYSNNAARVTMTPIRFDYGAATGKGAPAITTHSSMNVMNRRPLNNDLVSEGFSSEVEIIDWGNKQVAHKFFDEAKITRELRFIIQTPLERQYWKKFLSECKGRREPFLVPTWRPDFVLAQQPAQGGSVIKVEATPHIIDEYSASLAHDWLYLQTDGVDHLTAIDSYLDNLDGTIDITMTTALNNDPDDSTVNVVSHMEQSRLGSDSIRWEHFNTHSVLYLSVTTVQA